MITIKHGSIFDSTADVLVCPVNCVGVMGKGLALEFKRRFPSMFAQYASDCRIGWPMPGDVWWHGESPVIATAATKRDWRNPSQIHWIDRCLDCLSGMTAGRWASIAIPQLGCGCGGLDWNEVWPLYEKHLAALDCDVEVWIHE